MVLFNLTHLKVSPATFLADQGGQRGIRKQGERDLLTHSLSRRRKTLLAFNLDKKSTRNLAGFTIQCQPEGSGRLLPSKHPAVRKACRSRAGRPLAGNRSINAPIHKFRWVHVPGSVHQGRSLSSGPYTYTVTPRFFDDPVAAAARSQLAACPSAIDVSPFEKKGVELGFTRGFTQSQAFVHHFGLKAHIQPAGKELALRHARKSGVERHGRAFHLRRRIRVARLHGAEEDLRLLDEVLTDPAPACSMSSPTTSTSRT